MQEQNFEKQVREKMEELSFAPSEPVWQRVEEQIRKKKDRRKVLLWLLPFLLVTGGVFMWANSEGYLSVQPGSISKTNTQEQKTIPQKDAQPSTKVLDKKQPQTKEQTISNQQSVFTQPSGTIIADPENSLKPNHEPTTGRLSESLPSFTYKAAHRRKNTGRPLHEEEVVKNNNASVPTDDRQEDRNTSVVTETNLTTDNAIHETTGSKKEKFTDTVSTIEATVSKDSAETKAVVTDSLKIARAKKKSRLQWTLDASGGVSGIATSTFKFLPVASSGVNSDAMALFDRTAVFNNAIPGNNALLSPAMAAVDYDPDIYTGISFSVGAGVKKSLSPRLDVTAGLHYNYYSTRVYIGKKINATTSLNRQNEEVKVNNYFLASGLSKEKYTNNYHFIALPLGIDWRVNKRIPLQLHSGVNISRLVATNALYYSHQQNIYYEDDDILQKTQFSFFTGLSYRLLQTKAGSLYAGPRLEVGLSNLLKKEAYGKQHLFFAGLNTHFEF